MRPMRQIWVAVLLLLLPVSSGLAARETQVPTPSNVVDHTQWVAGTLTRIQAVKPGMTRTDLLKVFRTEGGISTRAWRKYVYRGCPYVKVDVEFEAVVPSSGGAGSSVGSLESPADVIKSISKPYLEWSIIG